MPKIAGDPLTKTTLNLFTEDVEWFQKIYGQGWSTELRGIVHRYRVSRSRPDFDIEEGEF